MDVDKHRFVGIWATKKRRGKCLLVPTNAYKSQLVGRFEDVCPYLTGEFGGFCKLLMGRAAISNGAVFWSRNGQETVKFLNRHNAAFQRTKGAGWNPALHTAGIYRMKYLRVKG
jgi:hypothetical protein